MDNDFATGYALGSDSNGGNCNNGGFWGGDGWWAIIIFAMIFGWGRGGFGGFGGGGASTDPGLQGLATRADVNEAIAFNGVERGISAIQQGICDSTYALNNSITSGFNNTNVALLQGFNGVQSQMCNMAAQAQDCCCQTQRAIDGVNYNMATNTCAIQNTIQGSTRDILENNNSNTRAILDFLTQSKIDSLQAENQSLKLAASQANQNSYLTATLDAQTSELIRRINPMPVPAYQVPAPYPYCGAYNNLVISQAVAFTGGNLEINLPAGSYNNGEKYCVVVGQAIPDTTTINAPVYFTIGTGTTLYPMTKRNCAQVTACGIRTRTKYSLCVVTTPTGGSFRMLGTPCCSPSNNLTSIDGGAAPAPTA